MRSGRPWTGAVVLLGGAVCAAAARGADDRVGEPAEAGAPRPAGLVVRPAQGSGIDLAAHVDINVVLPTNQWRVSGGLGNIVIAGGGRLVIDGQLTVGGEPVAAPAERIRRTDEAVLTRLESAQRDVLATIAADRRIPAARRRALELATQADVRRVMAEVARLRDRYAGTAANLGDENWRRFQRDVQACRRSLADPFGTGSLFAAARAGLEADPHE